MQAALHRRVASADFFGGAGLMDHAMDWQARKCRAPFLGSSAAATFSGFTITVTCGVAAGTDGGPPTCRLRSTACTESNAAEPRCPNSTNPGPLYVERSLDIAF